jgi:hypothetical protein
MCMPVLLVSVDEFVPHLSTEDRLGPHSSPVILDTSILQYLINQIQILVLIMSD